MAHFATESRAQEGRTMLRMSSEAGPVLKAITIAPRVALVTLVVALLSACSVVDATGSVVYSAAVNRVREDVSIGHQLNLAMRQTQLFPNMVVQMVAIGEEAGSLDTMLLKVAEFYEEEVNNMVDALSSLIEPFIMVFIGTIVGAMVIGMYLPIFKIAATM